MRIDAFDLPFSEFLDGAQDDTGGEDFMDALAWIQEHPFDLNTVTPAELLWLPSVSCAEAASVEAFRKKQGRFLSMDQLVTMEGGSTRLYRVLSPYVTVRGDHPLTQDTPSAIARFRAVRRSPQESGSVGSPLKMSTRLQLHLLPKLELGALFTKDAGERARDGLLSGHLALRDLAFLSQVVIGDYCFNVGRGLAFSTYPSSGTRIWPGAVRFSSDVVPFRGTDESRFLRGGAATARAGGAWGHCEGTVFVSRRTYAATLDAQENVTAFIEGPYSTDLLAGKRNAVAERIFGWRMRYVYPGSFSVGGTWYRSSYNRIVQPADVMRFSGSAADFSGVDISASVGPCVLMAERACLCGKGAAVLAGAILRVTRRTSFAFLYRHYDATFDNIRVAGFSSEGQSRNEQGFYTVFEFFLTPSLRFYWSYDHFTHPWPSQVSQAARCGNDLVAGLECDLPAGGSLGLRLAMREAEVVGRGSDSLGRSVVCLSEQNTLRARCAARWSMGRLLTLSTRLDYSLIQTMPTTNERGLSMHQEVRLVPLRSLTLNLRLTLFHTDSYDARVYDIETDLPGTYGNPPLAGRGRRFYVVAIYTPVSWISLSAKYSVTEREQSVTHEAPYLDIAATRDESMGVQFDIRPP